MYYQSVEQCTVCCSSETVSRSVGSLALLAEIPAVPCSAGAGACSSVFIHVNTQHLYVMRLYRLPLASAGCITYMYTAAARSAYIAICSSSSSSSC